MKYGEGIQGFSEEALRSATFGRDVLACETHFFVHGGMPHLTLVLQLADSAGFDSDRHRSLSLKSEATVVAPVTEGVPFLGLRIFPECWRMKRGRFQRTRHTVDVKVRLYESDAKTNMPSPLPLVTEAKAAVGEVYNR